MKATRRPPLVDDLPLADTPAAPFMRATFEQDEQTIARLRSGDGPDAEGPHLERVAEALVRIDEAVGRLKDLESGRSLRGAGSVEMYDVAAASLQGPQQ